MGNELYLNFIEKGINGNLSVRKLMKRCNLKTFGSMRKSFKSVINNKEVHLKEEKNLMAKFLITTRKLWLFIWCKTHVFVFRGILIFRDIFLFRDFFIFRGIFTFRGTFIVRDFFMFTYIFIFRDLFIFRDIFIFRGIFIFRHFFYIQTLFLYSETFLFSETFL